MKIKSLLEQGMVQPLVDLYAEGKKFPRYGSLIFLLQIPDEG
jgi:hypothetical protein